MIEDVRRLAPVYTALAATAIKTSLTYTAWVWADFVTTSASMFIFVYFWRAVYAGTATLGGLTLQQTISYILLARLLAPVVETRTIYYFGSLLRQGLIAKKPR